jgi:hypothetical protein
MTVSTSVLQLQQVGVSEYNNVYLRHQCIDAAVVSSRLCSIVYCGILGVDEMRYVSMFIICLCDSLRGNCKIHNACEHAWR